MKTVYAVADRFTVGMDRERAIAFSTARMREAEGKKTKERGSTKLI